MKSGRRSNARGSASVEFALVLPLVLVVGLALLQVALFAKDQLVLQEAARAGARQAAVSHDDGSVRDAATAAASTFSGSSPQRIARRRPRTRRRWPRRRTWCCHPRGRPPRSPPSTPRTTVPDSCPVGAKRARPTRWSPWSAPCRCPSSADTGPF